MDGLEISEQKLSEVKQDNCDFRIDSQLFKKDYLERTKLLKPKSVRLSNLMMSGHYGILPKSEDYGIEGLSLIRGKDIRGMSLIERDLIKVPHSYFEKKYQVRENDILILVKGATIGNPDGVMLIQEEFGQIVFNGSVFRIRIKDINRYFVYAFMTTKFFTYQKILGVVNNGIEYNSIRTIRNYLIPTLDDDFQERVETLVKQAHARLRESKALYGEAEDLLLDELGLRDWQPPTENTAVKSFRESFLKTARLDAEYYQPKFDEFLQLLRDNTNSNGWAQAELGSLSEPLRYGSSTKLEYLPEGVPFLRIADVNNYRFHKENLKYISFADAEDESHASVTKGDVVISRSGTLGLAVAISADLEGAIFGSYFIRVRPKPSVDSDFLALFMNSRVGKFQVEQLTTGGIQTNLTVPAMESLKISLPPKDKQEEFVERVKESFAAQDQSKHLLETAKRAVEIAIEQNEDAAMEFILANTQA